MATVFWFSIGLLIGLSFAIWAAYKFRKKLDGIHYKEDATFYSIFYKGVFICNTRYVKDSGYSVDDEDFGIMIHESKSDFETYIKHLYFKNHESQEY